MKTVVKKIRRNTNKKSIQIKNIEEESEKNIEEDTEIMVQKLTLEEIHDLQDEELKKNKHMSDFIIEKTFVTINVCFDYTIYVVKFTFRVSGVYLLWIFLHYLASHLYIRLCVPSTFIGFLISPFMTATPHCQGLRWIVYNAANIINNMWVILGTWICSTLLLLNETETRNK